jgi:hypothetical protein
MANSYYLISPTDIETARNYAPIEGLPNQLFQVVTSSDGTKTIVQADWTDTAWLDANGIYFGDLQPDGSAPQAALNEVATWRNE